MKMDRKEPATLLALAIQSLLSNDSAAIHALGEIPRELFIPLFTAAFKGGHKKTLTEMVKTWPFFCLHIGNLSVQKPHGELLKAMVDGLQILPAKNCDSRRPKLRILDLRQDTDCRTTCPAISTKSPVCLYSCVNAKQSMLKIESINSIVTSESETQSSRKAMELLVDLFFDGTLKEREFISSIVNKIKQSLGFLHLCCRDLQIDTFYDCEDILSILDLVCIDNLAIEQASLSEVTTLLSRIVQLDSLSLTKIRFRSLNGDIFRNFLMHLGRMDHLKELNLSSFCLTNHLEKLLRVLPPDLDFLYLPFCEVSPRDFTFLSQCPQTSHLKVLNLSNNPMYWEDFEPFQTLLENLSGTLRHLEINNCLLTDSTMLVFLPALSHCSKLRLLSFASNPITMPTLMTIVQHLMSLMELKYVIYPIPVHCYEGCYSQRQVDRQKLGEVQTQLKMMLQLAGRDDMRCMTYAW
uniref:melanoma antigen preferentially expressed in tumors-like n=1 Tax=Jaculus jaculus TaxID=51337 RepID=UPI001E1B3669|nr:melanoma antigen preferentially expressed in tumors-like [Jaculus jaculus]